MRSTVDFLRTIGLIDSRAHTTQSNLQQIYHFIALFCVCVCVFGRFLRKTYENIH